ncbi:MAG: NADPH-dependent FMN reductase [Candidatus Tectimicrobiota bacterium]
MQKKAAIFVGSLRQASWNRKIAQELITLAPPSIRAEIVEIGHLPLYNQDLDDNGQPPAPWTAFRQQVQTYNAVLFVTPEYNRSVPAPLKNAIDVGSRPYGQSVWEGKPGAVVSASPSAIGAFGANHHVRQSLVFLNVPCLQMPEVYIGGVDKKFDAQGVLADESTREFLRKFMTAYAAWVDRNVRSS